ncbi:MAG: nucleotidyltransferase domain-containing protein, partial [Armatimonadetes bacterium]|nr:nucleotidyltransferase domain-containing protein [Armatimonadota bacterium]
EHGVRAAYLFGSRARGEQSPHSDHDLAVLFGSLTPMERMDRIVRLKTRLEKLLETDVDLVSLDDAPPLLAWEAVIQGKVLFCGDFDELFAFEKRVRARYEDLAASQRFFTQARRERLGLTV